MMALSTLLLSACTERNLQPTTVSLPLYHTETQLEVVECVTQMAKLLSVDAFVGVTGSSCRLLVGDRGSGKSVVLKGCKTVRVPVWHKGKFELSCSHPSQ